MNAALWYFVAYSLVIGTLMPMWWVMALVRGLVPETKEDRREIWFHVVAEVLTGFVLIAGGIATLLAPGMRWSGMISMFGLGLVTYTLIQSPGYYVDRGDRPMVIMFTAIWLLTIPAIVLRAL